MKMRPFKFAKYPVGWLLLAALAWPALATEEAWIEPVSGIEFVRLPAGCFMMGEDPPGLRKDMDLPPMQREDEQPRHSVCVGEFWIARTELAWQQWQRISGLPMPPRGRPVQAAYGLSWHQAKTWLSKLNEKAGSSSAVFRLPTEEEWEYACRAGSSERVFSGDAEALRKLHRELTTVAWYMVPDFPDRWAHDVGQKAPNPWRLHDMLGNVMEWVEDRYRADAYFRKAARSGPGDETGHLRVVRGGSYKSYSDGVRCGIRNSLDEDDRLPVTGMRVVMERRERK